MLEVGRVNFKHVGAHLMLEVRRARLLQAWLIYQSVYVAPSTAPTVDGKNIATKIHYTPRHHRPVPLGTIGPYP